MSTLTALNDLDRVAEEETQRERQCSCGTRMRLRIGLDQAGKLKAIECVEGTYLRRGGNHFALADGPWGNQYGKFLYCKGCQRRRAWQTFRKAS